jgi:hypothetical protein
VAVAVAVVVDQNNRDLVYRHVVVVVVVVIFVVDGSRYRHGKEELYLSRNNHHRLVVP